ncbi:MAG TPA: hypothetical protein VG148_08050 [Pyrinomonadaceae bacterium]|nr:hypothetical protein [Pyrinomonadaceae bacterium]
MRRTLTYLAFILAVCSVAMAQKGTADLSQLEFVPNGYDGDTWTGEVTKVDAATRDIELTHTKGDKTTTFNCVLSERPINRLRTNKPDELVYAVFPLDFVTAGKKPAEKDAVTAAAAAGSLDPNQLLGQRVTVYYVRKEKKVTGQKEKIKHNEVFRIKVLKKK